MKTLHTDFKLWSGDTVYYVNNSKVVETYVYSVDFSMHTDTEHNTNSMRITYQLHNGRGVTDNEIGTIYFTDKKELIQKLVSQL